ncbi:MAG: M50 family metallopeptidase [Elusimicrobiota bacterium]
MITILGYEITILQIFTVVFGIGLLIFVHELGHFLMAKYFRLRVEKFAFGFGPELIGFTRGETRYSICAFPLGGMVKLPGEDIDSATGSPDEFMSQAWYKRLLIAFFGPMMNYILAVLLFAGVVYLWGVQKPVPDPIIGQVIEGRPAQKAGILTGDRIISVNAVQVKSWEEMASYIYKHPEENLRFIIERQEKRIKLDIRTAKDSKTGYGIIGVTPRMEYEKYGLAGSVNLGVKLAVFQSVYTLKYLGTKLIRWEKPELAGPIGVIQILAKAAKMGIDNILYLLGVISVALGLFNLLPIPLVDGGHITIAVIECVTRKPINKKLVQLSNFVGLGIIIFIFIFATYSDIARIVLDMKK